MLLLIVIIKTDFLKLQWAIIKYFASIILFFPQKITMK